MSRACPVEPGEFVGDNYHMCNCMHEIGHVRWGEVVIHECICGIKWYDDGNEAW